MQAEGNINTHHHRHTRTRLTCYPSFSVRLIHFYTHTNGSPHTYTEAHAQKMALASKEAS